MLVEIVQVIEQNHTNIGRSVTAEARCGRHSALVLVSDGGGRLGCRPYVHVCVQNASHRAWKGMGKRYDTEAQALEHFKTPAVKAIISAVCARARAAA